jgi:CheY-like chemotaxis protein
MEDDSVRFLAAGIDRHLTKPLRKSALVEVLLHFCPPDAALGPVAAQSTAA